MPISFIRQSYDKSLIPKFREWAAKGFRGDNLGGSGFQDAYSDTSATPSGPTNEYGQSAKEWEQYRLWWAEQADLEKRRNKDREVEEYLKMMQQLGYEPDSSYLNKFAQERSTPTIFGPVTRIRYGGCWVGWPAEPDNPRLAKKSAVRLPLDTDCTFVDVDCPSLAKNSSVVRVAIIGYSGDIP